MPTLPALVMTNLGLFAESATAKAYSVESVEDAVTESCAHGVEVPMPVRPVCPTMNFVVPAFWSLRKLPVKAAAPPPLPKFIERPVPLKALVSV